MKVKLLSGVMVAAISTGAMAGKPGPEPIGPQYPVELTCDALQIQQDGPFSDPPLLSFNATINFNGTTVVSGHVVPPESILDFEPRYVFTTTTPTERLITLDINRYTLRGHVRTILPLSQGGGRYFYDTQCYIKDTPKI